MNINRLLLVTSFACATILPACKKQDIPDKVSLNISGTIQIDPKLKNSRVRCYGFLGANLKDDSVCDNLDIGRNIEDCMRVVRGLL